MNSLEKFLSGGYEFVDELKQNFVALFYDKNAQRLCVVKKRSMNSFGIYKILKELGDPHIPEIYRLFECDGELIVIEEHIDGQTLEEVLIYRTVVIDEKFALEILKGLCECLAAVHAKNIVHRDLKPSNIMIDKNNVVKLIDFGIARTFKPESSTDTEILGTRGYASPEQFGLFDFGQTDSRSDIYSLGVTIKQLLGEDYRGDLLKILNRCTALEPARRYQSVGEILRAVDNDRRLKIFKRCLILVGVFGLIFFMPAATEDIPAPEPMLNVESEIANEKQLPIPSPSPPNNLNQDLLDSLIDFSNSAQIFSPETPLPEIPPIQQRPTPNVSLPFKKSPRESFDGVDLYFYLNGKLTGTDGSHWIDINGWQNWTRHSNGVLFPVGWSGLLHVENHGDKDLIEPIITVDIGGDEFSVKKNTLKVGQSLDLNIPFAEKFAAPIKGSGHLQIILQPQGMNPIFLNRTFRLAK